MSRRETSNGEKMISHVQSKRNLICFLVCIVLAIFSEVKSFDLINIFVFLEAICYLGAITFSAKARFYFAIGSIVFTVVYVVSFIFSRHCCDFGYVCNILAALCLGCLTYLQLRKKI